MSFEARRLRVQLPCKDITVITADEHDAQVEANRYWRAIALAHGGFNLPEGMCDSCSANPSEPQCPNASQDINLFAFIDETVLPILRQQLEARLREVTQAEEAVANARGGG